MTGVEADGDFRLPPEFPVDETFFIEKERGGDGDGELSFPSEFPYNHESSSSSSSSSPVESVLETESDDYDEGEEEEDFMALIAREMAHSFLHDEEDIQKIPTVCSPARDSILGSPGRLSPPPVSGTGYLNPAHTTQNRWLQVNQQHQVNTAASDTWGRQNQTARGGARASSQHHHHLQQQQQQFQGMRAFFLGRSGGGAQEYYSSTGTGVFLPRRRHRTTTTVLVPAKVMQALNLNLDHDGIIIGRNKPMVSHK